LAFWGSPSLFPPPANLVKPVLIAGSDCIPAFRAVTFLIMKPLLRFVAALSFLVIPLSVPAQNQAETGKAVYVIPVRDQIATPVVYVVRRGIKQAMEAKADAIILDMDTNGGALTATTEIVEAIEKFKGLTATYVNRNAFSAGAFIAVATQKIYMAPQSVIGAAAPIMMGPTGGVEGMPDTVERKMTSGVSALVRTSAEKNGHNIEVIEGMINKNKEVKVDDEVINEKGEILTLTNLQAEKKYGPDQKPLLSLGTVESIDALIAELGFAGAKVVRVDPTGAERVASWLTTIGPLLLLVGIVGTYIEMKTPGFGIPGIVGVVSFILYFAGGYIAGLSGLEWTVVFVIGLALFLLEIFVFPGTLFIGLIGGAMMLAALVMAMVDFYPGMPAVPSFAALQTSLLNVLLAAAVAMVLILLLSRYILKVPMFHRLVAIGASGSGSDLKVAQQQKSRLGEIGTTISPLRPGGKAQFGETILDVISQGEMIPRSTKVRVIGFSGSDAIVEPADPAASA
jgi:membrane-bound serine protease (ClpP class)